MCRISTGVRKFCLLIKKTAIPFDSNNSRPLPLVLMDLLARARHLNLARGKSVNIFSRLNQIGAGGISNSTAGIWWTKSVHGARGV